MPLGLKCLLYQGVDDVVSVAPFASSARAASQVETGWPLHSSSTTRVALAIRSSRVCPASRVQIANSRSTEAARAAGFVTSVVAGTESRVPGSGIATDRRVTAAARSRTSMSAAAPDRSLT